MTILPLAFFDSFLSPSTMIIVLVVAVLLYGERCRRWPRRGASSSWT